MLDPLSVLCVLLGSLILAGRGPLIFAPTATLRFFRKFLATDARIRASAVVPAPLAAASIVLPLGEGEVAGILRAFGWLWAAVSLWLLAAPDSYRRIAGGIIRTVVAIATRSFHEPATNPAFIHSGHPGNGGAEGKNAL